MVTYDASEAAGAAPGCTKNTRAALTLVFVLAETAEGRAQLRAALRLCAEVKEGAAEDIAFWVQVRSLQLRSPPFCMWES